MVDVPARLVVVRGELRVIVEDNGNLRGGKVCFQLVAVLVPYYLVHVDTEACVVEDAAVVLVRGELAPEDGDGLYLRESVPNRNGSTVPRQKRRRSSGS